MLPEDRIKKIARLPANCVCPNCATEKRFGFGNVCMLSLAFVCNDCKSSHQAYSHRCKSLTMSTWTDAEVLKLTKGGNDVCRRSWLAKAPPVGQGGRPQSGSDLSIYKRFIEAAYVQKLYYVDDEGTDDYKGQPASLAPTTTAADTAPSGPPVAVTDLLGFDAFESTTLSPASSFFPAPSSGDAFLESAGASASMAMTIASPTRASTSRSVPSQSTVSMQFDPFGLSMDPVENNTSFKSRDSHSVNDGPSQCGSYVVASPFPTAANMIFEKKPVMEIRNGTASAISAMGALNMGGMVMPPTNRMDTMWNTVMSLQQPVMMTPVNMTGMIPPSYQPTNNTGGWSGQQQQLNMMMSSPVHQQQEQRQSHHSMGSNGMPMFSVMNGAGGTRPQKNQSSPQLPHSKQDRQQQTQSTSRPDPFANLF